MTKIELEDAIEDLNRRLDALNEAQGAVELEISDRDKLEGLRPLMSFAGK